MQQLWNAEHVQALCWANDFVIPAPAPFLGTNYGPSDNIKNLTSHDPINIFKELLTPKIIDHIVFQTNLYAEQSGKFYIPTSPEEILVFIGINFLMGIKPQPSYRDYWSSRPELHDEFISKLLPIKRFSWILSHIHLNDISVMPERGSPNFNKLYKVQPFLDMLLKRFQDNFDPGEYIAVDESMIKFKGRSTLKQYMPKNL